jgi:hypothetical protein
MAGMSKPTTTRDWQFTATLSGLAIGLAIAGGSLARSEANLLIMAVGGFIAGLTLFSAIVVLDRIYPQV